MKERVNEYPVRHCAPWVVVMFAFSLSMFGCGSADRVEESPDIPSGSDIWLFEMSDSGIELRARVTERDGYDNQPMFTPDGMGILFTSDRAGRAHTHLYDVASGTQRQISFTDADKYSPTPIPGTAGSEYSVVHTDSTTRQGLWRYSVDGSFDPKPVAEVDDVAYYTWVDSGHVLFWRLNSPSTLQLLDVTNSDTLVVMADSAFSFKRMPGERSSLYLASWSDMHSEIRKYDWDTGQSVVLADALGDGRDFGVTPGGRLLMMSDDELYGFDPGRSDDWELIADLDLKGGSRIAVSPDGRLIAVVASR